MINLEIRQFIVDNFLFGQDDGTLSDNDSLMDKGIIDSTGIIELVFFVEEKSQIKVEDEDLTADNLDSIGNLVQFIEKKLSNASLEAEVVQKVPGN